ncbi:MAG: hypothetical protein V2I57_13275 [Xanthomonadales bacterium]|nr:hypothetical protein [Xanthomonadales bacterium]
METFLFGPGERLFGAYHEGFGPANSPPVLICNGLGQDYLRGHLVLRLLARRLSAVGGPVLHFDYRGTGDSAGDPETNTLAQLREDTAIARQELMDISGHARVVILGLRLGAWLALEHSDRVVVWDPILSGRDYVDSLVGLTRELDAGRDDPPPTADEDEAANPELAGYRYAGALLDELCNLDLADIVADRHYERLALVLGDAADDPGRDGELAVLGAHVAEIDRHPAKAAHWRSAPHLERALTPFPSIGALCEAVSRW